MTSPKLFIPLVPLLGLATSLATAENGADGARLSIATIPLLKLVGAPGTRVTILVRDELAGPGPWQVFTNVTLQSSPGYFADWESISASRRFFTAVPAPPQALPMVWVSPGTFQMGSASTEAGSSANERPVTHINLTRGFWMGRFEVTQAQYRSLVGKDPSTHQGDVLLPVDSVSWRDATNYCGVLTHQLRQAQEIDPDWEVRLPTEAEWEFACRAGTQTAFSFGDSASSFDANFDGSQPYGGAPLGPQRAGPTAVGSFPPNPWGIYDMHGNVWEWCLDSFDRYPGGVTNDPVATNPAGNRTFRGGSWYFGGALARSASRNAEWSSDFNDGALGFRVVFAPGTAVP